MCFRIPLWQISAISQQDISGQAGFIVYQINKLMTSLECLLIKTTHVIKLLMKYILSMVHEVSSLTQRNISDKIYDKLSCQLYV